MKKQLLTTIVLFLMVGFLAFSQAVPPQTVEFIDNITFTEDGTSTSKDVGNIHQILLFLTITADPVSYIDETLEVIIETQDPDGVWHTKQSFIKIESNLTVPYYEYIVLDSFGSKLRIDVKVTGTAPSYTISVKGYGKYGGGSSGGGGAPASAHYLTDQAEAGLSAEVVVTANGKALVTAANYAAMRTLLDLEPGVDYQAYDASLTSIAGLTYASGSFIALTAEDTYGVRTYAQTLSDIGAAASSHAMSTHSDEDSYTLATSGSITSSGVGGLISGSAANLGALQLFDGSDHNTIFNAGAQAANITYTLPVDDGDNTEVLQTNGSGVLSWVANAGGGVDTSGTPVANDYARFTDVDTIEGREYSEVRTDLGLVIGTDVQASSTVLTELTALTDPGADSFPFWNDTTNNYEWSTVIFPIAGGVAVGAAGNAGKLELEDADGDVLGISVGVQAGNTDYVWPTAFPGATGYALTSTDAGTMGWDSDITDLVTAATTGAAGKSELATIAEVNAGTDTTRAITVDALAGSNLGTKTVVIKVYADDGALTLADGEGYFTVPAELDGMDLVSVGAHVYTASGGGTAVNISIYNVGNAVDMLTTQLTIDNTEKDSATAATPAVISAVAANRLVNTGDEVRIDLNQVGDAATKGLEIRLGFQRVV